MSELKTISNPGGGIRSNLLANVSLLALLGLGASQAALAESSVEEDRPVVWIELGGQFERSTNANQLFAPPFLDKTPAAERAPLISAQTPSPFSIGGEGKIAIQPKGTDWIFSAGISYGRSSTSRHDNRQLPNPYEKRYLGTQIKYPPGNEVFGDGQAKHKESHAVLDFQVGKDVGLGLFGSRSKSVINIGVRFAQFATSSSITLNARPDYKFGAVYTAHKYSSYAHRSNGYRTVNTYRHTYSASLHTKRSAHGIGPSLSWDVSLPVAETDTNAALALDWGVNAAILFGRQRADVNHQTNGEYHAQVGRPLKYPQRHYITSTYARAPVNRVQSRSVTIPNLGGFAGVTFQQSIAKISVGYRADFFFGALDGGIDTAKKEAVGLYGPFAKVSIGLP